MRADPIGYTQQVARGMAWMLALRWAVRLVGIFSVVILARLLTPSDFGVVAMAIAFVELSAVFLEFGVGLALVRDPTATREHFDSAWTLRILQSATIGAVVIVGAPFVADFYNDSRVSIIAYVAAGSLLIQGFQNIGIVWFEKDLSFRQEFQLQVSAKLLATLVTLTLAYLLRSYWALVLGTLALSIFRFAISYYISDYRPRLSFKRIRQIWSFSQWNLVRNIGLYATARGDNLAIGRLSTADGLGFYTIAREIAELPLTELVSAVARPLNSAFSLLQTDRDRLRAAFNLCLGGIALAAGPLAIGLALVAKELILLALGEAWLPAAPMLQVLCIYAFIKSYYSVAGNLLIVLGEMRRMAIYGCMEAVVFVALLIPAFAGWGIVGVVWAKVLVVSLDGILMLLLLNTVVGSMWKPIIAALWRPLIGTVGMAAAVLPLPVPEAYGPVAVLVSKVAAGGFTYVGIVIVTWIIAGRPKGAERLALEAVERFMQAGLTKMRAAVR